MSLLSHLEAVYGKLRRVVAPRTWPVGDVLRLHLGCGSVDHAGFVNIDGRNYRYVHFVQPLSKLSRFENETVSFIYISHALEHFSRDQIVPILKEWRRTLVPGGRLCISVPDFDRILEIYELSERDADAILPPLFGGQDYPFNFHYTTFNEKSLTRALTAAGFSRVERWQHGADEFHNLPDWSGRSIKINNNAVPISLNLEATKID